MKQRMQKLLRFNVANILGNQLVSKGSITVDGVSLTVFDKHAEQF